MKNLFLPLFILIIWNNSYSQSFNLFFNKNYKYFIGNQDPDTNWKNMGFNDSAWKNGYSSIGYGDSDDTTVVDTTASVYIRHTFNLDNDRISRFRALIIYADYDDGFIAYLNGKEILRVNIDKNIVSPDCQTLACRSHEAEAYRFKLNEYWINAPVTGFYIDSATVRKCGLSGSNILTFEIHNDSLKGSDLTFNFDYDFRLPETEYYFAYPECRYRALVDLDSTRLPIINIETDEFGTDSGQFLASMKIISNEENKYNHPYDKATNYDGRIRMNIRGHSTRMFPKKSFRIELQDSAGNNKNVSLLGMPPENDWVLLAQFADKSLISNEVMMELGRRSGNYEPRTRYCQLILNGINQGIYVLEEKVKRDKNRVPVRKNQEDDLTGGYIFTTFSAESTSLMIEYPRADELTPEQEYYLQNIFNTFDSVLHTNKFTDPSAGYTSIIDPFSLADVIIFNELAKNTDAYHGNFYSYKDCDSIDKHIKFGPLWDFDHSFGNGIWADTVYNDWKFGSNAKYPIHRIIQDTAFTHILKDKWHRYRSDFLNLDSIYKIADHFVDTIANDVDMNFKIWPILDQQLATIFNYSYSDYSDCIHRTKDWIKRRINWMDENIDKLYFPLVVYNDIEDYNDNKSQLLNFYPNPFNNDLTLAFNEKLNGRIIINITDLSGRTLLEYGFDNPAAENLQTTVDCTSLQKGIYLLTILMDGKRIAGDKIVKL